MDVSNEKQTMCITQLPDHPLIMIYQNINKDRDQIYFGLTCHRFLDIALLSSKCLDCTKKLSRSHNPDSMILDKFFNHYRHLKSPSLISDINLSYCAITDDGLETLTKSCRSLVNVSLIHCSRITNTGIWFVNQNCRQLRALKISGCDKVVGVRSNQGSNASLVYLQADSHVFYPTGFLTGGGIEYLDISYNSKYCTNERGLAAIGSGIAKNLKILNFWMCSFVTDDIIMKISKGCPLLQELNLSNCVRIGLDGWKSIGLNCRNLKRLHVNGCSNLCDSGLLELAYACDLLTVLYMTHCVGVSLYGRLEFEIVRPDVTIEETIKKTNFPSWVDNWASWPYNKCVWG